MKDRRLLKIAQCINYNFYNCCTDMHAGNTGAQLIDYGNHRAYFKPWYFDGKIVYWGEPETTQSSALDSAQRIKQSISKRSGFVSNW